MAEVKRIEYEDDPRRCQHVIPNQGQCTNVSEEGTSRCIAHQLGLRQNDKNAESNYNLIRYKADLIEKRDHSQVKSLRDEVGILRLMMEKILNSCKDDTDLLIKAPQIGDLSSKIERTVVACHKLEDQTGQLLDKTAILRFAGDAVSIIAQYIEDEETIQAIAGDFAASIAELGEPEDRSPDTHNLPNVHK